MRTEFLKNKKIRILLASAVGICVLGGALWYFMGHRQSEPVYVFPFEYVGMTQYWGDTRESYGPVTTDKIQTVYLSDTQTVTGVSVKQGDAVKKGDLLLSYDTTLSELALERKRLEVEKKKLELQDAQKQLDRINSMKPMVIPDFDFSVDEDGSQGTALTVTHQMPVNEAFDGSELEKAMVFWIRSDTRVDGNLFEIMRSTAETFQNNNAQGHPNIPPEIPPEESGDSPEEDTPGEYVPFSVNDYYVVVKVTHENYSLGQIAAWQGMHVVKSGDGQFYFTLFDASMLSDYNLAEDSDGSESDFPNIDFGSGLTAAQIAQMRSDQEKKILDLNFDIKMAEANYKIMQTEVSDGNIYSEIDGTVVSVLTEEEAKKNSQPVLKISGGGGFYVEGYVSELDKDQLQIGQEVTISNWQTGMVYTATVQSIGDFPDSQQSWSGAGNPTASYYPYLVFVEEDADLQAGTYASVSYSAGAGEQGVYLENPYVRTENGNSYVMVRGENGRLEMRSVSTGKALWGSYTEITSGLTVSDFIAFPYGKTVKPGVPVQEGDMSNLPR